MAPSVIPNIKAESTSPGFQTSGILVLVWIQLLSWNNVKGVFEFCPVNPVNGRVIINLPPTSSEDTPSTSMTVQDPTLLLWMVEACPPLPLHAERLFSVQELWTENFVSSVPFTHLA